MTIKIPNGYTTTSPTISLAPTYPRFGKYGFSIGGTQKTWDTTEIAGFFYRIMLLNSESREWIIQSAPDNVLEMAIEYTNDDKLREQLWDEIICRKRNVITRCEMDSLILREIRILRDLVKGSFGYIRVRIKKRLKK